jgi:hypothetical protein
MNEQIAPRRVEVTYRSKWIPTMTTPPATFTRVFLLHGDVGSSVLTLENPDDGKVIEFQRNMFAVLDVRFLDTPE